MRVTGGGVYSVGTEFTITELKPAGSDMWARMFGDFYAMGDPRGHGVWEKYLKLVPVTRYQILEKAYLEISEAAGKLKVAKAALKVAKAAFKKADDALTQAILDVRAGR